MSSAVLQYHKTSPLARSPEIDEDGQIILFASEDCSIASGAYKHVSTGIQIRRRIPNTRFRIVPWTNENGNQYYIDGFQVGPKYINPRVTIDIKVTNKSDMEFHITPGRILCALVIELRPEKLEEKSHLFEGEASDYKNFRQSNNNFYTDYETSHEPWRRTPRRPTGIPKPE